MTATAPLSPSACSRCGRALPTDAPAGLCPRCLLSDGFGHQSEFRSTYRAAAERRFIPPTVDELAAEFPQLEFIQLLGSGGMGAVYLAKQIRLDRKIAVKILPPDLADDAAFAERFLREARALARLSHPNIVGVFDFGQSPGGLYYFLMEYIEGPTLRQVVATRSANPKQALEIVRQVCDALQFAHDKGVVHRDIKPENILLDQRGRVKIADFGLAKLLGLEEPHPGSPAAGSLTGTRQAMGTPHYMAPEQITGSRAVDHRADIYSLGVVFYELLTGELPLGRFAPPSKKVQIDVRLDEVVLRTLESEPAQRYQHASDVKTDVESISYAPHRSPTASVVGATAMRFVRDAGNSAKTAARTMLAHPGPGETSRLAIFAILWAAAVPVVLLSIMFYEAFERWLDPLAAMFAIIGFAAAIPAITAPIGATLLGILSVREIRKSNGHITGLVPGFAAAILSPLIIADLFIWAAVSVVIAFPPLALGMINPADDWILALLVCGITALLSIWADIKLTRMAWRRATEDLSPELVERELRAIPRPLRTAGVALLKGFDRFNHELLHLFGKARTPEHLSKARHQEHPSLAPTYENQPAPQGPHPAQAPLPPERMSLKAIVGACLLVGLPLAVLCAVAAVQFQRTDAIELPLWGLTFLFALIPLFATTILGWIAIGDIRRSAGRLTGLPLALFDALFFPLLILDAVIAVISMALTGLIAWGLAEGGQLNSPTPVVMIAILFGNLIGLVIITIVDTLIVRAIWRRIKPQSILRAAEDEIPIPPDSDTSSLERESFFRKHRELIAAGAAIGAATLLFAIKATHEGWGPFNTSRPNAAPSPPQAPTQPGLPRAATDEQAQQYLEDTKRRWRLGPDGPELSPGWADNLGIVGATKEKVDQALQSAYADYERMLDAHTTIEFEGDDAVTFRITPIRDDLEQITDKFWSDVDPLLNIEQQKLLRYNLPLVHASNAFTPKWSADELILPLSLHSTYKTTIEIERSGQWYVYNVIPHYQRRQTVPELPLWLRRWQDKYDQLISLHSEGLNVDPTRWPLVAPKPNPSIGAAVPQEGPTANNPEYEHLYRQLAQWKVDPQSIRHIDRIIRMVEFEYDDILKAHTIERVENGTVIFEVRPFPDKIASLERQFWDHVDPLLTVEQQRLMRLNFPVGELPNSTAAIKGDEPTGLIPLGRHGGMTLRIERFGQWYRWDLDLYTEALVKYGIRTFETPSLPYWLHSFQKHVDAIREFHVYPQG